MAQTNVLLFGGSGQFGTEFQRLAPSDWRIVAPDWSELDIADPAAVARILALGPWALLINAAAYTEVDRAEREIGEAWRANALGPAMLAEASARAGVPIIHLSTDYVFDGIKDGAYCEYDAVAPLGVYGASKEGGEQAIRTGNPRHIILRTAWLVSPHGKNFIKTILRLAAERPLLRVVDDQRGSPTSAADLAATVTAIGQRLVTDPAASTGTYHFVNGGEATWFELARAVLDRAAARGRKVPPIEAIPSREYPTPAKRPANSRLSTSKLQRDFDVIPRLWRQAIEEIVDELVPSQAEQKVK